MRHARAKEADEFADWPDERLAEVLRARRKCVDTYKRALQARGYTVDARNVNVKIFKTEKITKEL